MYVCLLSICTIILKIKIYKASRDQFLSATRRRKEIWNFPCFLTFNSSEKSIPTHFFKF